MTKRILFICRNIPYPNSPANSIILKIAQKLLPKFEIDILFPKEVVPAFLRFLPKYKHLYNLTHWNHGAFHIKTQNYIRLPISSFAFLFSTLSLPKTTNNPGYSLIHAHLILPDGILAYHYAKRWKIPYLITIRNSDIMLLNQVKKFTPTWLLAKKILKNAASILVLNKAASSFLSEHFNETSLLIPHGIDKNRLIKKPINFSKKDEINISVVGEAIKTKQIDWVIKAFQSYKGEKNITLNIVGSGKNIAALEALAQRNPKIKFTGKIPHSSVFEILLKSDIFTLPSCEETFGLVYLEAAATSNAIIAYRNTGIYGLFDENQEIIYVENYTEFKNQLFNLIEDASLRFSLQKKALQKVEQYTWDRVKSKYYTLYNSILD